MNLFLQVVKTRFTHWWQQISLGDLAQADSPKPMSYLNSLRLLFLSLSNFFPTLSMRSQQLLGFLAGILTTTGLFMGATTPAQACDRSLAQQQDQVVPVANVRLGMAEAELVKSLGQPERRGREPVRCPTNRVHLKYAKSLVVLKPRQAEDVLAQAAVNRDVEKSPNLVVVGITSADPAVVIAGGIHVGLDEQTAIEKLAATCDRKSLAKEVTREELIFHCTFSGEPVKIWTNNGQVSQISVGAIYPRELESY
jgi:hypothetical protein